VLVLASSFVLDVTRKGLVHRRFVLVVAVFNVPSYSLWGMVVVGFALVFGHCSFFLVVQASVRFSNLPLVVDV